MHRFVRLTLPIFLIAARGAPTVDAFRIAPPSHRSKTLRWSCINEGNDSMRVPQILSRTHFIGSFLLPVIMGGSTVVPRAVAADDLKGTKKDPAYEACLSQCMYTCTKPKGEEQKSRAVCLSECKAQCATTKQQLMLGTPISQLQLE
jgi:hypothetical protein